MGEPLKYDLRGLYSTPVAKIFLLVYGYCKILRCHDCTDMMSETVRFLMSVPMTKSIKEVSHIKHFSLIQDVGGAFMHDSETFS